MLNLSSLFYSGVEQPTLLENVTLSARRYEFIVEAKEVDASQRIDIVAPHPMATVKFDGARAELIGEAGQGFKLAMRNLDVFRTTVAGAALGFARRALDRYVSRAYNMNGVLGPLSAELALNVVDATPPPVPTGVSAVPGSSQIVISWTPPTDRDTKGFFVNLAQTENGAHVRMNVGDPVTCNGSTYTIVGLTAGHTYYINVTAVDAVGNESQPSLEVSATPGRRERVWRCSGRECRGSQSGRPGSSSLHRARALRRTAGGCRGERPDRVLPRPRHGWLLITMILLGSKFVKAVPSAQAPSEAAPVIDFPADQLPESSSYMVYVVQLKHRRPIEVAQALQPFARMPNSIVALKDADLLILRDYSSNIRRMLQIVERVDREPAE